MANVQIKSEKVTAFGGIFHVMDVFERLGLVKLVDSSLGERDASWNAFRYGEVAETLFCSYLCGGDCLEVRGIRGVRRLGKRGDRLP